MICRLTLLLSLLARDKSTINTLQISFSRSNLFLTEISFGELVGSRIVSFLRDSQATTLRPQPINILDLFQGQLVVMRNTDLLLPITIYTTPDTRTKEEQNGKRDNDGRIRLIKRSRLGETFTEWEPLTKTLITVYCSTSNHVDIWIIDHVNWVWRSNTK